MTKLIIGNMTGNSMDAIDLILTRFDGDRIEDICSYSQPYDHSMQQQMQHLRLAVCDKTPSEILKIREFIPLHNKYIAQIAAAIDKMCALNGIDKSHVDAIGFHGKTLDHNPPSRAKLTHSLPYTLQIGSGKMLADLTKIRVVYDFRSAPLMAGFEAAPLIPPHNANIAKSEGDGIYFNAGNTSNFAVIYQGKADICSDCGPCNEYIDNFIRAQTNMPFDQDGKFGAKGKLDKQFLEFLYNIGRSFYEAPLPKSGDPAYYYKEKVFNRISQHNIPFADAVRTLEYFAAYIAAQSLTLVPEDIFLPNRIIMFGGGWKNPVIKEDFINILKDKAYVFPEHIEAFRILRKRWNDDLQVKPTPFSDFMEARLCADMARYRLENKPWPLPECILQGVFPICGVIAEPAFEPRAYDDMINTAAKGWQTF